MEESSAESIEEQNKCQDIFDAAAKNDLESVKYFVETKKVPIQAMNEDDQTAAHVAAKNRNLPILRYLTSKDRKVLHMKDKWDQSVLQQAVKAGELEMVKYLVDGCKSNPLTPQGKVFGDTCIHIACQEGHLDILKYFLEEKKLDPNKKNTLGEPPMFLAAEKMQLHIVKYLCEKHNADPTVLDNNQKNILFICATKGDITIPTYLLDERKVPLDINWRDVFGQTLITTAARYDQLKFMKYMVEEKKADINIANANNLTAIQEAASEGYAHIVKYLYEKGAKADLEDLRKLGKRKELKEYFDSIAPTAGPSSPPSSVSNQSLSEPKTSSSSSAATPSSLPSTVSESLTTESSARKPRNVDIEEAAIPFSLPHSRLQDIIFSKPAYQIGELKSLGSTSFNQVGILFALASVYLGRRESKRKLLLSPSEILKDKMDPIAIEVVEEYLARRN